ncbi:hypothetical protein AB1Y20_002500 [Prymnesium parvum]|uniref:Uncharacterized protein n=1 Tax=Prymnesium parvum TaxID=97485 RepID=A0AB34JAT4_PRYPA
MSTESAAGLVALMLELQTHAREGTPRRRNWRTVLSAVGEAYAEPSPQIRMIWLRCATCAAIAASAPGASRSAPK